MIEIEKLNTSKERILSTIRFKGPVLPVQIAKEINFSPLFASAFLSELRSEGKIKISNMRVGSSPLYYLPGQEAMLEKFVPYLNQREKEAFQKLKQSGVLEDSEQEPVVRVALRAIKDFAVPVQVRVDSEMKLFWKYFVLPDDKFESLISGSVKKSEEQIERVKEILEPEVDKEKLIEEKRVLAAGENSEDKNVVEAERVLAEKKKVGVVENSFIANLKDYLARKNIEILHIVAEKKKEFEAKIRINTDFGRQTYYLVAKDKASANDADLVKADKKARGEKLPAVFMAPGDLNKKGRQYLEQWGNLVRFERLEF